MPSIGTQMKRVLHLPPRRYQIQAVRFLEENDGRGILGDDMGLGKTFEAIAWAAIRPEIKRIIVVCPSNVKWQWQDQLKRLARMTSCVLEGRTPYLPSQDISIINYDILSTAEWPEGKRRKGARPNFPWVSLLRSLKPQLVVLDECHYIKNTSALRTRAAKALCRRIPHVIGCSGTPVEKAPVEFFPILNLVAPEEFPSFTKFVFRYCAPKRAWRGRGWDFSGTSHLDELYQRTSDWIIRRLKKDVAKELPPKIRTVLPVPISNMREYQKAQRDFLRWVEAHQGRKAAERAAGAVGLARLGTLKRMAGQGKLHALREWVEDFLETGEKLVVFAVHRELIRQLHQAFPSAAVVTGDVSGQKRPGLVKRFQEDPECRIFIGQLKAAGIGVDGLHLASSTVLFAELGWNFSEHEQAEDRVLRIGQESRSVNMYYLVGKGTVEESILGLIQSKADIVRRVLHGTPLAKVLFQWRENNAPLC